MDAFLPFFWGVGGGLGAGQVGACFVLLTFLDTLIYHTLLEI